mgnify:CR=1 FL=1
MDIYLVILIGIRLLNLRVIWDAVDAGTLPIDVLAGGVTARDIGGSGGANAGLGQDLKKVQKQVKQAGGL